MNSRLFNENDGTYFPLALEVERKIIEVLQTHLKDLTPTELRQVGYLCSAAGVDFVCCQIISRRKKGD